MPTFPQLSTGASAQYPVQKIRSERTILNLTQDGRAIALSDANFHILRWNLTLQNLTTEETGSLTSFFELCEGPLQSFTFLDPTQNLLSFSEDLTQPAWQHGSLLQLSAGIGDPFGTTRASRLFNSSAAALQLAQTIQIPGSVWCAFSVYLRSVQAGDVNLNRTDGSTNSSIFPIIGSSWNRYSLSTVYASSVSTNCTFSISIPAGTTLDIFGLQVDPQPMPGIYLTSTSETGVYLGARFDSDQLTITATGPGQNSAKFSIISKASQ